MLATARDGAQLRPPNGYTIVEAIIVMMIAAVLLTYGGMALKRASADRATVGARDSYVWLARRARALAVQRGTNVTVSLKPATSRALVVMGTTIVDRIYFNQQFGAKVTTSSGDSLVICYTPRGVASGVCSYPTGSTLPVTTVTFQQGLRSASAVVQALGQVEAQ